MTEHKKIAVIFGGRSPEHDVSIVSGLQVLGAIDQAYYEAEPIYISADGYFYGGDGLRDKRRYPLNDKVPGKDIYPLKLNEKASLDQAQLVFDKGRKQLNYDVAFPVLHGTNGEDGSFQSLMEMLGIAYTGLRKTAASLTMDKVLSKRFFERLNIPVLPCVTIKKPRQKGFLDIEILTKDLPIHYPVCAKPNHLGSSIGVHICFDEGDLQTALLDIFKMDSVVIVEPFIPNLVEYNIAVRRLPNQEIAFSAIEKPLSGDEASEKMGTFLDFKAKYQSGGDRDSKLNVQLSDGMVSATRTFEPKDLSDKNRTLIYQSASLAFEQMSGHGAPRFDFYGNAQTGELWLNEINPIPGSYGYFLWEKAPHDKIGFTDFTSALIEEAIQLHEEKTLLQSAAREAGASLF